MTPIKIAAVFFVLVSARGAMANREQPGEHKLPIKVFVLAGQSNMEGQAVSDLAGKDYNDGRGTLKSLLDDPDKGPLVRHLRTADGQWTVRDDVWCRYQRTQRPLLSGPLTIGFSVYGDSHHFGPELQFGHVVGEHFENPVLLIKTAWGGKSLYKDFRPPSSGGEVGPYYTQMITEVRNALANLKTEFPNLAGREAELAGFVWYHGWNDGVDPKNAVPQYEQNLVNLINDVRKEFADPKLPVVIGELTGPWVDAPGAWDTLRKAQAAAAARPESHGNVLFVETHDFVRKPEESPNPGHGHHEFGNAETYVLVGDALGKGMAALLTGTAKRPERKPDDPPQPVARTTRELEGWKIRVDDRLLEPANQELANRTLKFVEAKLVEIKAVVPAERLEQLQDVTIVLDLTCGKLSSMQYHPSAGWLKANGYPEDLAKCVHLPRAADVLTRRNVNEQPWFLLHELAHAFHDQKLDFDEPRIKGAFENYKASGRGDATLLYNGKRVKHYALTNPMEFFAEMTESYFGVNDFFPFNRAELETAEPDIFALLHEIWRSPKPPAAAAARDSLHVSVFRVDATPPLGTPVAYAPARKIEDPLTARGIVLLGVGQPIVLCAVDWIGISNGGHDAWRESLAAAVGTSIDRVAVHVLHQHDAVRCDFTSEELLAVHGLSGKRFDVPFVRRTIAHAAQAAKASLDHSQPVTHLGVGEARVEKVASNRRILGPDGRVAIARSSSYRIPEPILSRLNEEAKRQGYELSASRVEEALAAPEGVIDPLLKMLTFYHNERAVVSLSYYATHPQSYFGKGDVTSEFVGLARAEHEQSRGGLTLVHFNGASGNVAAGKYNDGTPEMRVTLTKRMAEGMRLAWTATQKSPLNPADCEWRVQPVLLPIAPHLDAGQLRATLENPQASQSDRLTAAGKLAFVLRRQQGLPIELSCLKLGRVYVLHMPGELFVEYQLAAQQMRPDGTVCMAAYGDTGTGYIGTQIAYSQGGYETQPSSSNTAPSVERVLLDGIRVLLK